MDFQLKTRRPHHSSAGQKHHCLPKALMAFCSHFKIHERGLKNQSGGMFPMITPCMPLFPSLTGALPRSPSVCLYILGHVNWTDLSFIEPKQRQRLSVLCSVLLFFHRLVINLTDSLHTAIFGGLQLSHRVHDLFGCSNQRQQWTGTGEIRKLPGMYNFGRKNLRPPRRPRCRWDLRLSL
jgi:hypothetical protein